MMRRARGLTVIELMVGITLIGVVLAITIPGFRDILERRRLEGVANELSADLQYARSEAVGRRVDVVLTTAADGASTPSAACQRPRRSPCRRESP